MIYILTYWFDDDASEKSDHKYIIGGKEKIASSIKQILKDYGDNLKEMDVYNVSYQLNMPEIIRLISEE